MKNSKPPKLAAKKKKKVKSKVSLPPEDKPFDFGGLPDRDLKKNLGCG